MPSDLLYAQEYHVNHVDLKISFAMTASFYILALVTPLSPATCVAHQKVID